MRFIDIFRMAFGNLKRNKMRTTLTVAGVVVGIGAIVFLVSLGFGLQDLMIRKVANLEALTLVTVRPGNEKEQLLNDELIDKLESLGEVVNVSPVLTNPASISIDDSFSDLLVRGIRPEFIMFEELSLSEGAMEIDDSKMIISSAALSSLNIENNAGVIDQEVTVELYKRDGKGEITQNKTNKVFTISGIVTDDKVKFAYVHFDNLKILGDAPYYELKVKAAERNQVETVRRSIESMGYPTTSIKDTVDQIDQAFMIIKSVLGAFGMIALFVAAIGIFNTMTISLLERTHEIGVMKAIGGRNKDVSRIFSTEAAIIGLLGGLFGVGSGWILGMALNGLVNFIAVSVGGEANDYFSLPIDFVLIVIAFSFVVSTVAGIWPARRAAKLNPLEALRYE